MEREELKFCEVHTALFLAGTNLGLKLDPTRRSGLKLWSDEAKKRVYIEWNGETGWTPETNVAIAIPGMPGKTAPQFTHPIVAGISGSAQVETPYGHVHQGPGAGKKGK